MRFKDVKVGMKVEVIKTGERGTIKDINPYLLPPVGVKLNKKYVSAFYPKELKSV
jgi:hypothetical protein